MSLRIVDLELTWITGVPLPIAGYPPIVQVQYLTRPVFQADAGGVVRQDQGAQRRFAVNPATGAEDFYLQTPTELGAPGCITQIIRQGGSLYQGIVPEGVSGPITFDQLILIYGVAPWGWQVVTDGVAPQAPYVAVPGPSGRPLRWAPWNATATFTTLDAVYYLGSSFLSKLDVNVAHTPPGTPVSDAYWQVITSIGATGPAGGTGATRTVTANYAMLLNDSMVIAGAPGLTMTLPDAVQSAGMTKNVANNGLGSNTTLGTLSAQTINGGLSPILRSPYSDVSLFSDGTQWLIV